MPLRAPWFGVPLSAVTMQKGTGGNRENIEKLGDVDEVKYPVELLFNRRSMKLVCHLYLRPDLSIQ